MWYNLRRVESEEGKSRVECRGRLKSARERTKSNTRERARTIQQGHPPGKRNGMG
jgi:hypothetical protein